MKMTLDKRLDMIAEDISALERFVREVAQHTAQIERTCDSHGHVLYYIDKKISDTKRDLSQIIRDLSMTEKAVFLIEKRLTDKEEDDEKEDQDD